MVKRSVTECVTLIKVDVYVWAKKHGRLRTARKSATCPNPLGGGGVRSLVAFSGYIYTCQMAGWMRKKRKAK